MLGEKGKMCKITFCCILDTRFPNLTDDKLKDLLSQRLSKNAKLVISRALNVFNEYRQRSKTLDEIETM